MNPSIDYFRFLSLNCRKQPEVLQSLLNDTSPNDFDALCIQEPPARIRELRAFRSTAWHLILPTEDFTSDKLPTRSAIYINKRIPSHCYTQVSTLSLDITALTFQFSDQTFLLASIYNPPKTDTSLRTLQQVLATATFPMILAGDFNQHHPLWAGPNHPAQTRASDTTTLLQILHDFQLDLCLPPGTPTFLSDAHHTWSTIDLVFASTDLANRLVHCKTGPSHGSDHLSTLTSLHLPHPSSQTPVRHLWKETEWDIFTSCFDTDLHAKFPLSSLHSIQTTQDIDSVIAALNTPSRKLYHRRSPWPNHRLTRSDGGPRNYQQSARLYKP